MNAGASGLSRVREVTILPRGISDHAPLSLQLSLSSPPTEGLWHLSRFWLSDSRVNILCKGDMIHFWNSQDSSVSIPLTWDAFMAFVRGSLQGHIGVVRRGGT